MTKTAVSRYLAAAIIGVLISSAAAARDAAFLDPGVVNGGGPGDEAVKVEPKNEIDIGDSAVGSARRTTLFFVNEGNAPVKVEKVEVNSDANVKAEITGDDCSKQGTIAPQSRCTVEVSVTPSSPGAWSVETLLTHNGAGRIARAKLTGKTSGSPVDSDKKETGLSVASKEASPVNFGEVAVDGKAVRSALMINDSPDPITLYSIDVIEANNGLERLDEGCAVDMELKPEESCPVTLVWTPGAAGQISTDLIIRHSGRLGFAVIPVRGTTKGDETQASNDNKDNKDKNAKSSTPPPPTADELDKATAGKIPPVAAAALPPPPAGTLRLIGTVGDRAVLLLPDNTTKVAAAGDEISMADDRTAKVMSVGAKSASVLIDGKTRELKLEAAKELVAKAAAAQETRTDKDKSKSGSGSGQKSGSSSSTSSSTPLPASSSGAASGKSAYGGGTGSP